MCCGAELRGGQSAPQGSASAPTLTVLWCHVSGSTWGNLLSSTPWPSENPEAFSITLCRLGGLEQHACMFSEFDTTLDVWDGVILPLSVLFSVDFKTPFQYFCSSAVKMGWGVCCPHLGAKGLHRTYSTLPQHPRVKGFTPPRNFPVTWEKACGRNRVTQNKARTLGEHISECL